MTQGAHAVEHSNISASPPMLQQGQPCVCVFLAERIQPFNTPMRDAGPHLACLHPAGMT